ncbi:MAG TPA: nuclear transport factor 2 family protein [Mycobacterium sp.]|nr:nuclear transport factor 2 family protein [Mycobacterium sp.]
MNDTTLAAGDLVRILIRAVDAADQNAIATLTATDVHFRFGNADPTDTQSELLAAAQSIRDAIADLHHTILDLWEVGDGMVVALMDVHYRRLDGRELTLPCCNIFRVHNGLVDDYRIYMDVNPVLAP